MRGIREITAPREVSLLLKGSPVFVTVWAATRFKNSSPKRRGFILQRSNKKRANITISVLARRVFTMESSELRRSTRNISVVVGYLDPGVFSLLQVGNAKILFDIIYFDGNNSVRLIYQVFAKNSRKMKKNHKWNWLLPNNAKIVIVPWCMSQLGIYLEGTGGDHYTRKKLKGSVERDGFCHRWMSFFRWVLHHETQLEIYYLMILVAREANPPFEGEESRRESVFGRRWQLDQIALKKYALGASYQLRFSLQWQITIRTSRRIFVFLRKLEKKHPGRRFYPLSA